MATPIIMPRQGQSVESCIIAKWHKQKGDNVEVGNLLFSYETDKANFDEEAEVAGVLLDIFFEEGDDVPVLTNVCVIGEEGESVEEFRPGGEKEEEIEETKVEETIAAAGTVALTSHPKAATAIGDEGIKISPRARNLAIESGVSYENATPTGPYGRIIEREILDLIEKGPVPTYAAKDDFISMSDKGSLVGTGIGGRVTTSDVAAALGSRAEELETATVADYEEVPITNIRRLIGQSMHRSLQSTAQLTLDTTFDATEILKFRQKIKASMDKLNIDNITLNDMILFAVSRALIENREINAYLTDESILMFNRVNLGVAVDTPRGLMVPTIFDAETKSLDQISKEAKLLADECKSGSINPDKLKGGTFTVTNLGSLGIEYFTPVLNPPQVGILGVNTIVTRVREVEGGYEHYPAMGLSLTFDHRAIDGAPAARFLMDIKNKLENFTLLLTK